MFLFVEKERNKQTNEMKIEINSISIHFQIAFIGNDSQVDTQQ